jgi:hypothetical protein
MRGRGAETDGCGRKMRRNRLFRITGGLVNRDMDDVMQELVQTWPKFHYCVDSQFAIVIPTQPKLTM